ncbi:unnamed protein product [Sphenostylis stenocarpa]|uniref:Uncharacterized protein n=1 Tax=Sphenostylis stenocarpa TaxID=92480 RepID=A0AA86TCZ7_9FABA|nr:unnamed protein product [Sphenostylis stenocarpa]
MVPHNLIMGYPNLPGFVTAQGRDSADDPGGFVFEGGSITGNGWDAWNAAANEYVYIDQSFRITKEYLLGPLMLKLTVKDQSLSTSELEQFSYASFIDEDGWIDNLPSIS